MRRQTRRVLPLSRWVLLWFGLLTHAGCVPLAMGVVLTVEGGGSSGGVAAGPAPAPAPVPPPPPGPPSPGPPTTPPPPPPPPPAPATPLLEFVAAVSSSVRADSAFLVEVRLVDSAGVSSATHVALSLAEDPSRSATLSGSLTQPLSGGVARFSDVSLDRIGEGYRLRATAVGASPALSEQLSVGASRLAITGQPSRLASGQSFAFAVEAQDRYGTRDPTFAGQVTLVLDSGPTCGDLGGTTSGVAVGGLVSFSGAAAPSLSGPGDYRIRAVAGPLTPARSAWIEVVPAFVEITGGPRRRVQIGAETTLAWVTSGTPSRLRLDPVGDVTGLSQRRVSPFPTGVDCSGNATYFLHAESAPLTSEIAVVSSAVVVPRSNGHGLVRDVASSHHGFAMTGSYGYPRLVLGEGGPRETTLSIPSGVAEPSAFFARYDAEGQLLWARPGYAEGDDAYGVACALLPTGEMYALGFYYYHVRLGPGEPNETLFVGYQDAFLSKFDPQGRLLWAVSLGKQDTDTIMTPTDLAVGPDGSCCVVGRYSGTPVFGAGQQNETTLPGARFQSWLFAASYSSQGELRWATHGGAGRPGDTAFGVARAPNGDWIVTGSHSAIYTSPGRHVANFYSAAGSGGNTLTLAGYGSSGRHLLLLRYDPSGRLLWGRQTEPSTTDRCSGSAVAVSSCGDIYVAGHIGGRQVFGPGESNQTVLDVGFYNHDAFLGRFGADGNLVWVKHLVTSTSSSWVEDLEIQGDGHIVAVGRDQQVPTFMPGSAEQRSGKYGPWITRVSPDGRLEWGLSFSSGTANGVAPLPGGSVIVGGQTNPTGNAHDEELTWRRIQGENRRTFEILPEGLAHATVLGTATRAAVVGLTALPGDGWYAAVEFAGSIQLSPTVTLSTSEGVLLARYDKSGELRWATMIAEGCQVESIASRRDHGVLVSGSFTGTTTFGPGGAGASSLSSAGAEDAFLAAFDSKGTLVWAKRAGGPGTDTARVVCEAEDRGVWLVGECLDQAVFGPGEPAQTTITQGPAPLSFVAKFSGSGALTWVHPLSSSTSIRATGVTPAEGGSVCASFSYEGTIDFAPAQAGGRTALSAGRDSALLWLDASGVYLRSRIVSGAGLGSPTTLHKLSDGSLVFGGDFAGALVAEGGGNADIALAGAGRDGWIANYSLAGDLIRAKQWGGPGDQSTAAISASPQGGLVVACTYLSGVVFDSGLGSEVALPQQRSGKESAFARYDSEGNLRWARRLASTDALAIQPSHLVVAAEGTAVFGGRLDPNGSPGAVGVFAPGEANQRSTGSVQRPSAWVAGFAPYSD